MLLKEQQANPEAQMRIIGLAGWSGAGKTTLVTRLIPHLTARGISVSTVKHAHHAFDVDKPGKDSYEHRQAGAREVLVSSELRFVLMHELRGAPEPRLAELLARLAPVDLVIVEGFKRENLPKIEIHRAANGKPYLHPEDAGIVALATDAPADGGLPTAHLDDVAGVAELMLAHAEARETLLPRLQAEGIA